ncbi:unnamed protein product [Darwinula stevensoni]|uniref:Uncharacterized protein n=1 Tax=Darwinula stevensoni TaxID=69355 RepID=A0A7R9A1Z1_9CRUS|nr:unnamed protein product [Darwinula stevensoni]CAG0884609.1 unnamed protein product [Darwinula stevensoni]
MEVGGTGAAEAREIPKLPSSIPFGFQLWTVSVMLWSLALGKVPGNAPYDLEAAASLRPYQFGYQINDDTAGVYSGHKQERDGSGITRGQYSYIDPAGTRRTVTYTADPVNGYQADVQEQPAAGPPTDPIAANTVNRPGSQFSYQRIFPLVNPFLFQGYQGYPGYQGYQGYQGFSPFNFYNFNGLQPYNFYNPFQYNQPFYY